MKILFLAYNTSDSCSFYRSAGIIKDLQRKTDHEITSLQWGQVELDWAFLGQFDIIMLQRPYTKESLNLCNYIKQCGIKLWVDWDDDLFHVNRDNPTFWIYSDPKVQADMKGILALADVVTVPTEYLKQVLQDLNKNIEVIPNAFNDTLFVRPDEMPKRTNHVVWRGMASHVKDLMSFSQQLEKVITEMPGWRYAFMGLDPWWIESQIIYYKPQDVIGFMKTLSEIAPALIHVPLLDNVFNRCKSNIAAIEGSFAGVTCIVPEWWNMPGTLTYSDQESYYKDLRSVLAGEVDIVAQNLMAWEYIMDCLRLSKVNVQRIEVINSLL